ncbi:NAD(P)-binding domain-containing protein [Metabacillus herbersteinensis]|uniref:NAD(P)-binding domain-containing protein n=1 Tax=Metabacillus herbersteinensis TaxID=283816 RepID=UPI00366E33F6
MNIGIIGYGEVGRIFIEGLLNTNNTLFVYDILLANQENKNPKMSEDPNIHFKPTIDSLASTCDLIFSLVNSGSAFNVAEAISKCIKKNAILIDLTTSTPQVKKKSEELITIQGARYIDAAIMGTVVTEKFNVPIIIGGDDSGEITIYLKELGFNCVNLDLPNGSAASIKLLRSVFMKGLEALILETMIVSKHHDVLEEVMNSISTTMENNKFSTFSKALFDTHHIHKVRRFKEVTDSCKVIEEAKITPYVTEGVKKFFSNSIQLELEGDLIKRGSIDEILSVYEKNSLLEV